MPPVHPDWSDETEGLLRASGWYPGRREVRSVIGWRRNLTHQGHFQMSLVAERILEEFGGLHVHNEGPGMTRARAGFDLNPDLARGEEDRFREFGAWDGPELFPLGEISDSHFFLGVDDQGVVYVVGDSIEPLARNIRAALDAIILGKDCPADILVRASGPVMG